jgi:hypothetical protein
MLPHLITRKKNETKTLPNLVPQCKKNSGHLVWFVLGLFSATAGVRPTTGRLPAAFCMPISRRGRRTLLQQRRRRRLYLRARTRRRGEAILGTDSLQTPATVCVAASARGARSEFSTATPLNSRRTAATAAATGNRGADRISFTVHPLRSLKPSGRE